MAYDITYTGSAEKGLEELETDEQDYVQKKLNQIASSEFRHPAEWDFKRMEGQAEGRFRIGNGLRIFADINNGEKTIRVHRTARRENLYR